MTEIKLAPIALFVYNRPWHTKQTVEALQKNDLAKESEFFIYSDGPKHEATTENVKKVREYIRTIEGFREVTIIEWENNLGLAASIISGVTEVINKFGCVIVVEDDLVVSAQFLTYMNVALGRYENDNQVMQISAHMFPVDVKAETDAVFMPFTTSWGWATWQRAWKHFDADMSGYETLRKDSALRRKFDLDGSYPYFDMLEAQRKGKVNSWAIRWYLSVFMAGGVVLHPVKSLVKNIGFDNSGINCSTNARFMTKLSDFRVLKFPIRPEQDWQAYKICKSFLNTLRTTFAARMKELFNEFINLFI